MEAKAVEFVKRAAEVYRRVLSTRVQGPIAPTVRSSQKLRHREAFDFTVLMKDATSISQFTWVSL